MKYLFKLTLVLLLAGVVSSCTDVLNPATPQSKPIESIETVDDLRGLMNGAYSRLSGEELYGRNHIIYSDVRTANAFSNGNSGRFDQPYQMIPSGADAMDGDPIWQAAYEVIANTNLVINSDIEGASQVKGEAYATRALAHLIILKWYGQAHVDGSDMGIPYVTTFGDRENFFPERLNVQATLDNIGSDFEEALSLLDPSVTTPIHRMTYYGAKALQARYFLYKGDYAAASAAAKEVIDSGNYSLADAASYVSAWEADGGPAVIFEVDMNQTDNRGSNSIFQMLWGESYGDIEVTEEVINLYGASDVRSNLYDSEVTSTDGNTARLNYRLVGKYSDQYDDTPVIRYAEVILTYAEAEARLGNPGEALTYLNMIPNNRNASTYATASVDNILLERRKEMVMEGDYYWQLMRTGQDIERTGMRPEVSQHEVTVPYGDFKLAFPIPLDEINANPNVTQNKDY